MGDDTGTEVRQALSALAGAMSHLATKAEVKVVVNDLRAAISATGTRIIKWMIATALTAVGLAAGLAFSIARLVH
jgi:hypothetical protein